MAGGGAIVSVAQLVTLPQTPVTCTQQVPASATATAAIVNVLVVSPSTVPSFRQTYVNGPVPPAVVEKPSDAPGHAFVTFTNGVAVVDGFTVSVAAPLVAVPSSFVITTS